LWILEISTNGVFGVTGWLLLMTLPGVLLLRRVPGHQWFGPDVAPVAALSLMGNLYALDCLSNAMINPIYFVAVGAVTSCVGALPRRGRPGQPTLSKTPSPDDPRVEEAQAHADQAARLEAAGSYDEAEYEHRVAMGLWENLLAETPSDLVFKLELARSYEGFARNLAARGRFSDAETLWNRVVELLDALLIEAPDDVHAAHRAAEARNDLAWMLASLPETTGDVATRAVQWAEAAIRLAPDHPACWNTLATAYYRAGAGQATLEVLERATRLGYRHPGYDDLLMAMAYCRLGEFSLARQWFHRGAVWANSQERSHLPDLQRLHDEAAELLKQSSEPQIALVPPRTH
jgi:tetratricopeptide (TPR) repeat protein